MATNIVRYLESKFQLPVEASDPATPVSGDPIRVGELTGIALTDEAEGGNAAGFCTGKFDTYVATHSVKGIDDSGNSAVAVWDSIFYVDADTPKLSKKASGYFYGFALAIIGSGDTATIELLHVPAGSWIGSVATGDLAAGAVTAAKLSTSLKTGFIPVPLTAVFEGDGTNTVAALGPSTTPVLDMANGDTDSGLLITWAATNVDEVIFQVPLPPDLNVAADVTIHIRAAMEADNDTPAIDADSYFNEGDTKVSDASTALDDTFTEKVITIAAADVPAGAQTLTCELTPQAHGTDDLYISAIWVEYERA